ncbi:B3 domain-containing protein [Tripterygium wilfordii]|uniref:B3 domain-containing protein n=1 Tax=Tripterygium wilfordii TaxID=458696 RepID=A0A7J7C0E6_TRIWF|nr:B3 domain-containing protein Os01g0234100 [Tripterygium wilfordii]KAF5727246.1 B3 domain-containing protein [Tripterygium wilfordii]
MAKSKVKCEQSSQNGVEEKKKRKKKMEGLKLNKFSLDLKTPKSSPTTIEPLKMLRSYKRRDLSNRVYASDEERLYAIKRAEKLRSGLGSHHPSFVKPMLQSHVTGGFWLGLPCTFCKRHLPQDDEMVTLVDEEGVEFQTKYLALKTGLSGGWRGFSIDHHLVHGDAVVFQLVKPTRFKVYIIRSNGSEKEDEKCGLPNLNGYARHMDSDHTEEELTTSNKLKGPELLPLDFLDENFQKSSMMAFDLNNALEVILPSESVDDSREVKSFENFHILVNGLSIDSELSDYHRMKFRELCIAQNSFLHEHLLKSISCKMAAEMITEIVNITEAIRASSLSTPQDDYETWEQTLEGFQHLGLNVRLLRLRLNRLASLALKSKEAMESDTCRNVRLERTRVQGEMQTVELNLLKSKEKKRRLDAEIEALRANVERNELLFQGMVNAPWGS